MIKMTNREKNLLKNYKNKSIIVLFSEAEKPLVGKPSYVRLRLIRSGRIKQIFKKI
jgi:hypothetical protein